MFTHPYLTRDVARERQRDILPEQQRLMRQFRDLARVSRRAPRAGRRTIRPFKRGHPAALPS
jgi:hypothetical protein